MSSGRDGVAGPLGWSSAQTSPAGLARPGSLRGVSLLVGRLLVARVLGCFVLSHGRLLVRVS